jgi:peptide/nickel transport system ATP-binding protein
MTVARQTAISGAEAPTSGSDEHAVVEVRDLRIELAKSGVDIVDEVTLTIGGGEVLGLVGESGSGKTTLGLALVGHARRGVRIARGEVRIEGQAILGARPAEVRSLWGRTMCYVPQDPRAAMNPSLRIGTQLREILSAHGYGTSDADRHDRVNEMLEEVRLPRHEQFLSRYPHQLSGGQLQRVALAMAFACRPRFIVFDEPTTGLDVTTQAYILKMVGQLCHEHRVAALYVTHDLAVVASLAMRVGVMYAGRLVELGPADTLFTAAAHPYTRRLVQAAPGPAGYGMVGIPGTAPRPGSRPAGCFFAARCTHVDERCLEQFPAVESVDPGHVVRCFHHRKVRGTLGAERPVLAPSDAGDKSSIVFEAQGICASYGAQTVLRSVGLEVRAHECLALVGESGSGKSTLAHCMVGLHPSFSGELAYRGQPLARLSRDRDRETRRQVQYIFQNPYGSLNPRRTVGQNVAQPIELFYDLSRRDVHARVTDALERVSLSPSAGERFPDQLSGGERQRVAIARALACEPALLICDEITSALDVSVQAAIIELLEKLRRELGLAMLFVTHNLPLVRTIAQRVAVMSDGQIVEVGDTNRVFEAPQAEYTRALLADSPQLEPPGGA